MGDQSQSSRFRLLFESALQEYQSQTGTSLASHPISEKLQGCDSIESITTVLQEQARVFSEFLGGDGRVMKSLKTIVSVVYTLSVSTVLGEAIGLSFPPAKAIFAGFAILLAAVKDVSAGYDALVDLLEAIGHFINRLDIYTRVPPTGAMTELIVKIMVELISTLSLVTKQIKQKRPMKLIKKLLGENEVEAVLQRLDRLTADEARTTAAQTLEVVYGLVQNIRVVMDDGRVSLDCVRDVLEIIQNVASDMNKSKRDKSQEDFQRWLSPPDPWKNHNIACRLWHTGTATWFIQSDAFSRWKLSGSCSPSLLWVHAKPGAGKTILCSSIIKDIDGLRKLGLASLVFFYCDFREDQKKDLRGLLSSLVVQLGHQSDSYCDVLSKLYLEHVNGSRQPSDESLLECLKEMLELPGQAPVYFIMDALDECPITSSLPSPRDRVLMFVEGLIVSQLPNLRICVTSRPETDIKAVLDPLTFCFISLHDECGQREDIENYIKSVVTTDRTMRRWNAADKQLVIEVLTNKAQGMFRWVNCQLGFLRRCLPGRIRRALDELPDTLDETYERALKDIDKANWEVAHRLLQLVAVATRPLGVDELAQFLGFDFAAGPIPKFHGTWLLEDPVYAVLSTVPSLLAIVDVDGSPVVQFSHFSVKEFLTSARLAESSDTILRRYHITLARSHTIAATACLGLLLHLDKNITRGDLEKFPLAEYAAEHWVDHARFEDVPQKVEDGMKRLFDPKDFHFAIWVWIHDLEDRYWCREWRGERPPQPRGTPLHYAALCGLVGIVKFLMIEHSQYVDTRGFGHNSTALHLACKGGHVGVACYLLDNGAAAEAQDRYSSTPLHVASKMGHFKVVRLLLEREVNPTAIDEDGFTPPMLAFRAGHVEVGRLFLEFGVDGTEDTIDNWTPLNRALFDGNIELSRILLERDADSTGQDDGWLVAFKAALLGRSTEAIRLLLVYGLDVSANDHNGSTLLQMSTIIGHVEAVRILLHRGADATARDNTGYTVLHTASDEGQTDVAGLLLEHGVDAVAKDDDGWTPLHFTAWRGRVDVARLLLDHGADTTVQDNEGFTPLHRAALSGEVEVARLLFEHGADAVAKDADGRTPLHHAVIRGHVEVARLLFEHGADATVKDTAGRTPLQHAAIEVPVELAGLLFEHGSDATIMTKDGRTPLEMASHLEVAHVLEHRTHASAQINHRRRCHSV